MTSWDPETLRELQELSWRFGIYDSSGVSGTQHEKKKKKKHTKDFLVIRVGTKCCKKKRLNIAVIIETYVYSRTPCLCVAAWDATL